MLQYCNSIMFALTIHSNLGHYLNPSLCAVLLVSFLVCYFVGILNMFC